MFSLFFFFDSFLLLLLKFFFFVIIFLFDFEDFDNGEFLIEIFCDDVLNYSVELNISLDFIFFNKDLKFKFFFDLVEKLRLGYFEWWDGDSVLFVFLILFLFCWEWCFLSEDWFVYSNFFFLNGWMKWCSVVFEESF